MHMQAAHMSVFDSAWTNFVTNWMNSLRKQDEILCVLCHCTCNLHICYSVQSWHDSANYHNPKIRCMHTPCDLPRKCTCNLNLDKSHMCCVWRCVLYFACMCMCMCMCMYIVDSLLRVDNCVTSSGSVHSQGKWQGIFLNTLLEVAKLPPN